jgi:hypothetical protein
MYVLTHNGKQIWHGSMSNCLRQIGVLMASPASWRNVTMIEATLAGYRLTIIKGSI